MKNFFPVLCAHLVLGSFLGASPPLNIDLTNTRVDPFNSIIDALTNSRNLEAKYTIESSPGPDFLAYRKDGEIPTPEIATDRLLELNTFKASQEVVWNAKAFHLQSTEKNNGITIKRQRLLSSDGLLVDYYPERPSAYIRATGYRGELSDLSTGRDFILQIKLRGQPHFSYAQIAGESGEVTIFDPALGDKSLTVSLQNLAKVWSGNFIEIGTLIADANDIQQ